MTTEPETDGMSEDERLGKLWSTMRAILADAQRHTAKEDGVAYLDSAAHEAVEDARALLCAPRAVDVEALAKQVRPLIEHWVSHDPENDEVAHQIATVAIAHLGHLLDMRKVQVGIAQNPSERDEVVAATVIQWLGSAVGKNFLRDLGWTRATP